MPMYALGVLPLIRSLNISSVFFKCGVLMMRVPAALLKISVIAYCQKDQTMVIY